MAFKRLDQAARPVRQWALVGYPGSGKSTFAAQMAGPLLLIDADHRFVEVARLAAGGVLTLSEIAADHVDPERVTQLLRANMAGAGVATIVVDSLTAIISPLVTEAVIANDAGLNKNRIAAYKPKAMALRLLQDAITGWGADTLWIYHLRGGMDAKAQARETTSISVVELARLRRSLNAQLRLMVDGDRRGVVVDWARSGRSGITLWDDTGCWRGMPERLEAAMYDGYTPAEQDAPTSFASAADAIAWGYEQGCFRDAVHTQNAYNECKRTKTPATAAEMWRLWIEEVHNRLETLQDSFGSVGEDGNG
jgi:hypothetical protein